MTRIHGGLDRLLEPRSIALIGASGDPRKFGGRPLAALRRHGYEGEIIVVNPRRAEVQGVPCLPAASDLPPGIDLAVILLPAPEVLPALRACADRGVPAAAVLGGGFAETGPEGAARQRDLAALAAETGMRILGPNCPGFVNVRAGIACSASAFATREELLPGPVSLVLGSGAIAGILADRAFDRGIGLGLVVCTGNAVDVSVAEVVRHLADDGETRAIGLFLEGVDPSLVDALREARLAGLGVAVLKVGRSERARSVVASHTAAIVGGDTGFDAVCASLGVVRVDDYDQLLETAHLLATAPRPGRRLAVVGSSGGMNAAVADAADRHGLALPPLSPATVAELGRIVPDFGSAANPVDISSALLVDPGGLGRALTVLARDPAVEGLVVTIGDHPPALADLLADAVAGARSAGRPLVAQWSAGSLSASGIVRLNRAGVPVIESPERCMRAIAGALRAAGADPRRREVAPVAAPEHPLPESAAKRWLATAGVPIPRATTAADPAALDASALGPSVVVKADCAGPVHKQDLGAVRVGVAQEEVRAAAAAVLEAARRALGPERVAGVLVEELVQPVAELIVSVYRDPALGPIVTVGSGGVLVDVLGDSVSRLAPVSPAEAAAMLGELRIAPLLRGHRGRPPADEEALARAVAALSALGAGLGENLGLVEVNPLAALASGACALDAVVDPAPPC